MSGRSALSFFVIVSSRQIASDADADPPGLSMNLTAGEIEALRVIRGPLALFRRGEPLALMPVTFLR